MKLELKHLAPYLPYELKFYNISSEEIFGEVEKIDVYFGKIYLYKPLSWEKVVIDYVNQSESIYKPILRPLSDLTKEIEEGKKPIAEWLMLCKNSKGVWSFDTNDFSTWEVMAVINEVNLLFKNHFDVFGLIEKGLAIDINTLPQSSE